MITEYKTISSVTGPIMMVNQVEGVSIDELAEIELQNGKVCRCKVLEIDGDRAVVQLFENTEGINLRKSKARFLGHPLELSVSEDMLGRIFDGMGRPADGGPKILAEARRNINGLPLNPAARIYPNEFIQTGVSAIDGLNALARGETMSIFSESGLPHAELAACLVRHAKVTGDNSGFAIVFAAIGLTFEDAEYFTQELRRTGVNDRAVVFMNLAGDPVWERISTPRMALTTAEYLAFERNMHVLVIMTDMTNYAEALREVLSARNDAADRNGYAGYLYTDLASMYERAGCRIGKSGSITLIPILTMPDDDITHQIPDIAGHITDGQIVLSRELYKKGIVPPVDVLASLSHMKDKCIGYGKTREDHSDTMNQLLDAYAKGSRAKESGEAELSDADKLYVLFSDVFERHYVNQDSGLNRSIEETLDLGWKLLAMLPTSEMKNIRMELIEEHLPKATKLEL